MKILFPIEYNLLHHLQGNKNSRGVIQNISITRIRKSKENAKFEEEKEYVKKKTTANLSKVVSK